MEEQSVFGVFSYLLTYIFFCGTGYRGGVWTWKDWEMTWIGVRAVKFPKNQLKKLC